MIFDNTVRRESVGIWWIRMWYSQRELNPESDRMYKLVSISSVAWRSNTLSIIALRSSVFYIWYVSCLNHHEWYLLFTSSFSNKWVMMLFLRANKSSNCSFSSDNLACACCIFCSLQVSRSRSRSRSSNSCCNSLFNWFTIWDACVQDACYY